METSTYKMERMNVIPGEKVNLIGGEKVNLIERRVPENSQPPDGESEPKLTRIDNDLKRFRTKSMDVSKPIHHFATELTPQSPDNYIPRQELQMSQSQLPPYGSLRRPPYSTMKHIAPFPEIVPSGAKSVNWPMLILVNLLYILFTWVTAITRKSHLQRQEEIKKQEEEKKRQEKINMMEEMKKRKRSKQSRSNKQYNKE